MKAFGAQSQRPRKLTRRTFLKSVAGGAASAGLFGGCAPVPLEVKKGLTPAAKRALVQRHAPILWFHEGDYFLPVGVETFFHRSNVIWRRPNGSPLRTLKNLGELNALLRDPAHRGENVFGSSLDLESLGIRNFTVESHVRRAFDIRGQGPEGVREAARKILAARYPKGGVRSKVPPPPYVPRIYARVVEGVEVDNRFVRAGLYDIVQYFFFFLYNDFWNQHEGDWDATVQVLIRRDGGDTYVTQSFHYEDWLMGYPKKLPDFQKWLALWPNTSSQIDAYAKRTDPLAVYRLKTHPMSFIVKGGHGAYPTPGFALFEGRVPKIRIGGFKLGGDNVIAAADERVVGRFCLAPGWSVPQKMVERFLVFSGVRSEDLEYVGYPRSAIEILENQPWFGFKGQWGEQVPKAGWSGPPGPAFVSRWDPSDLSRYNADLEHANDFTHLFQKISRFTHVVRETDKGESASVFRD